MNPLEERLEQLKAETINLEITADESKIAFNKVKEMYEILGKLDIGNKKNNEVFREYAKKYLETELNYLRDKIVIIRKVSPKSADFLEKKVNEYERNSIDVFDIWKKSDPKDLSNQTILSEVTAIMQVTMSYNNLHDLVNVVCNSFKDTIDFLDNK